MIITITHQQLQVRMMVYVGREKVAKWYGKSVSVLMNPRHIKIKGQKECQVAGMAAEVIVL